MAPHWTPRPWPGQRFSPLHEGDTSVACRGIAAALWAYSVSVPFTRGTPLWRLARLAGPVPIDGFSPLHEGDTSVAL